MAGGMKEPRTGKIVMSNPTPVKGGQKTTIAESTSQKGKTSVSKS